MPNCLGLVLSDSKRVVHVPADVNQSHISAVCCCCCELCLCLNRASRPLLLADLVPDDRADARSPNPVVRCCLMRTVLEPRFSFVVLERTLRSLIVLMLVLRTLLSVAAFANCA